MPEDWKRGDNSKFKMHGRKKTSTVASDAEVAAIQRKAEALSETVQKFFELKKKGDKTFLSHSFQS